MGIRSASIFIYPHVHGPVLLCGRASGGRMMRNGWPSLDGCRSAIISGWLLAFLYAGPGPFLAERCLSCLDDFWTGPGSLSRLADCDRREP